VIGGAVASPPTSRSCRLPELIYTQTKMTEPLPGRPIRSSAPHRLEKFHVYLFLVLGIALVGAGLTAMGVATSSPGVVGIGAGTLVAAGLIAFYFALAGSRLTVEEKSVPTDDISIAPLTPDPDPESQRPWPRRTSRKNS
jgi:hypothetical protein